MWRWLSSYLFVYLGHWTKIASQAEPLHSRRGQGGQSSTRHTQSSAYTVGVGQELPCCRDSPEDSPFAIRQSVQLFSGNAPFQLPSINPSAAFVTVIVPSVKNKLFIFLYTSRYFIKKLTVTEILKNVFLFHLDWFHCAVKQIFFERKIIFF